MADQLDRAEEAIEHELAEALRLRKPPGPVATGVCYYCLELVDPGLRWCLGTECMSEWTKEWERRQQNANG